MGFFKSLKRLFQGKHVAHNMNPLISEPPIKPNRAQRRAEEREYARWKKKNK